MRSLCNQSVFPIGLGGMPLSISGRPSEKNSINLIKEFLEHGGSFIDTANVYGLDDSDRGHNEKLIHKALKQSGYLNKILIASKGGATRPQKGWGLGEGHPKQLRKSCEQSLHHLKTETISLYYLHGPDPNIPLEESIGELILLKNEGKIQHIGISNVDLEQVIQVTSLTPIMAVQNRCNPFCKDDFKNGLISYCEMNQISYIPYCPLGGFLDHAKLAKNDSFHTLTNSYHISSYLISLSWLLAKGKHILPIPGMNKVEQIKENFKAVNTILDSEDINKIDAFPDVYSPKFEEK